MTAPHARQPQALPRPACTPTAIRAVLAANANDVSMPLRSLHFGPDGSGLVTFLVYPPDDLVLVVKIQWLGG